jgi:hypothetical protein
MRFHLRPDAAPGECHASSGEWQTFDIVLKAPKFDGDKLLQPARVTVFHNGVLVQYDEEIHGETGHRIIPEYKQKLTKGPLALGGTAVRCDSAISGRVHCKNAPLIR